MLEAGGLPAVEVGERARELRHVAVPVPVDARELVVALAGEHVRQLELVGSHEVHAEALAAGEGAVAARVVRHGHEQRRRVGAERRPRSPPARRDGRPPGRGDHRDARCERGHRLVEELVNVRIAHSHRSSRGSSLADDEVAAVQGGVGLRWSERWCAPRLSSRARGGAGDQPGERERVAGELVEPRALEAA